MFLMLPIAIYIVSGMVTNRNIVLIICWWIVELWAISPVDSELARYIKAHKNTTGELPWETHPSAQGERASFAKSIFWNFSLHVLDLFSIHNQNIPLFPQCVDCLSKCLDWGIPGEPGRGKLGESSRRAKAGRTSALARSGQTIFILWPCCPSDTSVRL